MDSATIPNASPQAIYAGKPRSFWTIVGLSVVTCGVYYIVYNFMVASELKRTTSWRDDEPFKPSMYMILFGSYMALAYAIPMLFGLAFGVKIFIAALASGGQPDLEAVAMAKPYQLGLQIYSLMISIVGYYVVYYFLKLNDAAATKVGAKPLGIRAAFVAYSVLFVFMLLNSIAEIAIIVFDFNQSFNRTFSSLEGISLSELGPFIIFLLAALGMTGLIIIAALYFLWRQTELVNHVWEAGRFAAPAGGQGYYAPTTQPHIQPQVQPINPAVTQYPSPQPRPNTETQSRPVNDSPTQTQPNTTSAPQPQAPSPAPDNLPEKPEPPAQPPPPNSPPPPHPTAPPSGDDNK